MGEKSEDVVEIFGIEVGFGLVTDNILDTDYTDITD